MTGVHLEKLKENAYRVLGLAASATQEEVERAARMMRLWGGESPPTPMDAAWLGAVDRSEKAIERAVMRLSAPELRVGERVWWFCGTPAERADGTGEAGGREELRHDGALARLCHVLSGGESTPEAWEFVVQTFAELSRSPGYRAYLEAAEQYGDFEKAARPEEVRLAQSGMGEAVVWAVAGIGERALGGDKVAVAGQVLSALKCVESAEEKGAAVAATRQLLDRFEDLIVTHCTEICDGVEQGWRGQTRWHLRQACAVAVDTYRGSIARLLNEIIVHDVGAGDQAIRVKVRVVWTLAYIADALESLGDRVNTRIVLGLAWGVAQGTHLEQRIGARLRPYAEDEVGFVDHFAINVAAGNEKVAGQGSSRLNIVATQSDKSWKSDEENQTVHLTPPRNGAAPRSKLRGGPAPVSVRHVEFRDAGPALRFVLISCLVCTMVWLGTMIQQMGRGGAQSYERPGETFQATPLELKQFMDALTTQNAAGRRPVNDPFRPAGSDASPSMTLPSFPNGYLPGGTTTPETSTAPEGPKP